MGEFDIPFFEFLFFKNYDKIYSGFLKKTKSHETAQDLAQLTFIKIWENRATYSFDLPAELQINRKAKQIFIDWLRKEAHLRKLSEELQHIAVPGNRDKFEMTNTLQLAIDQLPPICKRVFILAYIDGLSHKEIAQILSISVKTVDAHIYKALRLLRRILAFYAVLSVIGA